MTQKQAILLFEEKKVRTVWDDEQEKWYFSVADVVEVLTDSTDVKQYIKKMRMRDTALNANWGTICTPLQMTAADGKRRKIQAAPLEGIFVLSSPSHLQRPNLSNCGWRKWRVTESTNYRIRNCPSTRRCLITNGWAIPTIG